MEQTEADLVTARTPHALMSLVTYPNLSARSLPFYKPLKTDLVIEEQCLLRCAAVPACALMAHMTSQPRL
jgi:hypothetical protein